MSVLGQSVSPKGTLCLISPYKDPCQHSTWDQVAQNEHGKVNDLIPTMLSKYHRGAGLTAQLSGTLRSHQSG